MFCILQLYLRLYFTYLAHDIVRIITGFRFSHTFYVSLYTRKKTAVTLIIIIVQICFLVYNNFTLRFLVLGICFAQNLTILFGRDMRVLHAQTHHHDILEPPPRKNELQRPPLSEVRTLIIFVHCTVFHLREHPAAAGFGCRSRPSAAK